jgi:hypothetical protein
MIRTPIQLMQQQTQNIGAPSPGPQVVVNSPSSLSNSASQDSLRKRHGATISSMTNHNVNMAQSGVGSATSAAAIAIQNQQLEVLNRTQNKAM